MKVKIQHWRNPNQDLMSLPKFLECIEVFSITSVIDNEFNISKGTYGYFIDHLKKHKDKRYLFIPLNKKTWTHQLKELNQ